MPDDGDLRPVFLLGRDEEAARLDIDVSHLVVIRPHAEDDWPVGFYASVFDDGLVESRSERADDDSGAYAHDGRQLGYSFCVVNGDVLARALGLRRAAETNAYVVPLGHK